MTQTDALNYALAGLDVTRARIDTIARNISNAQTDGYTDKISSATVGALGQVQLGPVTRNVDEQLLSAFNDSSATVNQLTVRVNLLSQIETSFGTPSSDSSLAAAITNLQNAFQDLSVNPEQGSLYNSVLDAANSVARNLNSLSQTVATTNSQASIQIGQSVTTVNETLQEINEANNQIVAATGSSIDVSDELDKRDQLIAKLSGFLDITTFRKPNGAIAVYTTDGKPLVDNSVASI